MSATAPVESGRMTTARGVDLEYRVTGEGPTIAFVNSFFMPAAGWGACTTTLRERNRLLTYDLGPDGWSGKDVAEFDAYVADLDELFDELHVDDAYILGHSSGSQVAVAYAAAHPERVRGLVLVGPLVNPTGGERRRALVDAWRSAYLAGGFEELFDSLWWLVHSEATLRRAGRMGHRILRSRFVEMNSGTNPLPLFALSDTHQVEFAPDWDAIDMPTLLLTGEDDCVATASCLRETGELLRASRLVLVPRAGHMLYVEAADAFQEEVQRFVDGVEGDAVTSS